MTGSVNPLPAAGATGLTDAQLRATPVPVSGTVATTATDGALVTVGTTTDAEAAGNGTLVALLKRIRTLLSGGLPAALAAGGGLKVEGVAGGVAQPVSGTVTANAGTGPWPVTDNAGSLTVDAPVGTPAFVRLSDGAAAITALPVTDNAGSITVDAPVGTPVFSRLSDGTAALGTGNGTAAAALRVTLPTDGTGVVRLTDGTTATSVIAATAALKTDESSVAGTATVTAAAGVQKVGIGSGATGNSFVESTATNMAATVSATGGNIASQPGNWAVISFPASNTKASASKAAGAAGVRHVCTSISFSLQQPAATPLLFAGNLQLRDGATGAGTIVWQQYFTAPATASATVTFNLSGLNIIGTAATAMTAEFSAAAGLSTLESATLTGYSTSG